MLLTSKVEETYTVEDFIELGRNIDDMQYSKFAIFAKLVGEQNTENYLLYPESNVLYDYEEELKKLCQSIVMTDDEFIKYRYKPKLLSYDLYGSTELYFVILFINGMCSIKEFDRKNIKLLSKQYMLELLQSVYNAEKNYINTNRSSVDYTG